MGVVEEMADKLALDALTAAEELGDGGLVDAISKTLEASSTAAHEAYLSSIRARVALTRGRKMLEDRIKAAKKAQQNNQG